MHDYTAISSALFDEDEDEIVLHSINTTNVCLSRPNILIRYRYSDDTS